MSYNLKYELLHTSRLQFCYIYSSVRVNGETERFRIKQTFE